MRTFCAANPPRDFSPHEPQLECHSRRHPLAGPRRSGRPPPKFTVIRLKRILGGHGHAEPAGGIRCGGRRRSDAATRPCRRSAAQSVPSPVPALVQDTSGAAANWSAARAGPRRTLILHLLPSPPLAHGTWEEVYAGRSPAARHAPVGELFPDPRRCVVRKNFPWPLLSADFDRRSVSVRARSSAARDRRPVE